MKLQLLGGLTARQFLSRHWQKEPLLVRSAIPEFRAIVDRSCLQALASRDDTRARLIIQTRATNRPDAKSIEGAGAQRRALRGAGTEGGVNAQEAADWRLEEGPLSQPRLERLPKTRWTLLVQDVNQHVPEAADLLDRFDFIPRSRVDDLMVSFAVKGGGVGPHFDSYDVFLLQAQGERRWQISAQQDRTLTPGAPVKLLRHFTPQNEWVLGPGDMLYLPPGYAHCGTAVTDCITYSIGFRAPSAQELADGFLIYLQDHLQLDGHYTDPDLQVARHPGKIGPAMQRKVTAILKEIRWAKADVCRFLGHYLTEPGAQIYFSRPARKLTAARFGDALRRHGAVLALKSRMLYEGTEVYLNGERIVLKPRPPRALIELADTRRISARSAFGERTARLLYQWYCDGYLQIDRP
jgi:50S ribosomal protein L16 3-hydroxylase